MSTRWVCESWYSPRTRGARRAGWDSYSPDVAPSGAGVCTPSEAEGYKYTSDSRLGFARRAVSAEVCTPSEAEGNRMNERIEEWIMNEWNYKWRMYMNDEHSISYSSFHWVICHSILPFFGSSISPFVHFIYHSSFLLFCFTHPALWAPLNMRGIYKNNAPHFCEALNHFVMSLSWSISSGTR